MKPLLGWCLQEEEERGEQWQAKWFEPAPEMQILPGEEPAEVVPLWCWKGSYTVAVRDSMPAGDADWKGEAACCMTTCTPGSLLQAAG